jgi:hypothetical protein
MGWTENPNPRFVFEVNLICYATACWEVFGGRMNHFLFVGQASSQSGLVDARSEPVHSFQTTEIRRRQYASSSRSVMPPGTPLFQSHIPEE